MKKLVTIPLLFACYLGMGQATDPAKIIGKPIKIRNLIVAQFDFPNKMIWSKAKEACAALGNGWKLPNKDELNTLYVNKDKIGGINVYDKQYWSSSESEGNVAYCQSFEYSRQGKADKNFFTFYVRAIKIGIVQAADSASIIGKSITIGNLVVAQFDFPNKMIWSHAKEDCAALGKGWRLPTKDELDTLYINKDKIDGFAYASLEDLYWSSTEDVRNEYDAWNQGLKFGFKQCMSKNGPNHVRAVRAF